MITAAAFKGYEIVGADRYKVRILFTSDVAPTSYEDWLFVSGTTLTEVTNDARRQIAAKNALLTTKNVLAGIAVDTAIPVTAPAAAADPNPTKTAYLAQVAYLDRLVNLRADLGAQSTPQLDADIVAAKTAAGGANYQTAHLT